MTISVPDTRQYPLVSYTAFAFGDLTSAVASKLFEMPLGSIVTGGLYLLDTVFNSGTSDAITVGDTDVDEYIADANAADAVAVTEFTLTGIGVAAANTTVNIIWTGAGTAPTTGAGRVLAYYIVPTRFNENFE